MDCFNESVTLSSECELFAIVGDQAYGVQLIFVDELEGDELSGGEFV